MEITYDVSIAITGIKFSSALINKGNTSVVEDFNKIQYYVSCLRNSHMKVKGFHVGALNLYERVIAFIITWMPTPRGSNHVVLTEEDLVLVYYIKKNIKVNWIRVFKEHMQKSMRLSDYHFAYVIVVSKFLQYFEVDLNEELSEVVKPSHKINNGSLNKMMFIKVDNKWVSKEEEQAGPSLGSNRKINDQVEPDVGDQVEQGVGNQTGQDTSANDEDGPSVGVAEDYAIYALVGATRRS